MAEINDRVASEAKTIVRITNDNLICKDCVFRYPDSVIFGNASRCECFPKKKSNQVLLGGKCDEYLRE